MNYSKAFHYALYFEEPIQDIHTAECNYYVFTSINLLNSPALHAIKLAPVAANIILPILWNYLDGVCAILLGLKQLSAKNDPRYRQTQFKGCLNILSGVQLFVLSYNPLLTAALGISGAPAALAGSAFAFAMFVDLIIASIDFYNALEENAQFEKAKNTLLIKAASFVGMTVLAVGTFTLFTTCPAGLAMAGLAITILVSACYLYQHVHVISNKLPKYLFCNSPRHPELSEGSPCISTY